MPEGYLIPTLITFRARLRPWLGRTLAARRLSAATLAGLLLGCATTPLATTAPKSPSAPAATVEPAQPTPTPVGSVIQVGPLDDDGVPTSVEGISVFRGDELGAAIANSRDGTPVLAGGWFHGPPGGQFCALQLFDQDQAVSSCNPISLFEHRVGGKPILRIAQGDLARATIVSTAVDRPVAISIHTHDPRCVAADKGCELRPVARSIAWLGDAPLEPAPPRVIGTPPPGGISRAAAIKRARAESLPHRSPLVLQSAAAAPIWAVLRSLEVSEGDIWVWMVVFEADFVSPCDDCPSFGTQEVFLDYLTGRFIMARQ